MDKQKVEIKRGLPKQDLNLKVKDDPYFADYHFTMVKEEIHIKSEATENIELDVPFSNDKHMKIKEEFSKTRHVHEKNKPYRWTFQCTICQSKFDSKSEFDRHFATVHDKNTPYGCSIFFKVLDAKAIVKEHITRVHEKNKPFQRSFCATRFCSKSEFDRHLAKVHEKNKPCQYRSGPARLG